MKGILKFNLPEEKNEFKLALRALDYFSLLFGLDQELRGFQKYGHNFKSINELIDYIRKRISEVEIYDIE